MYVKMDLGEGLKTYFSIGNAKLSRNTLIFNFSTAKECPAKALGLCKIKPTKCYASKAERIYPKTCLPFRERQQDLFNNSTATEFFDIVSYVLNMKRNIKIKYLRFSEAGDFATQEQLDKFVAVCKMLKKAFPKLKIYGYSARRDLDFSKLKKHATINGQFNMISNEVIIVKTASDIPTGAKNICDGDCSDCQLCKTSKNRKIYFIEH